MYIYIDIKWDIAEYEGFYDTFQVLSLTDENQNDLAQYLAPEKGFASLHELKDELASILEIPVEDIIFEGV